MGVRLDERGDAVATAISRRGYLKLAAAGAGSLAAFPGLASTSSARGDLLTIVQAAAESERQAFGIPGLVVVLADVDGGSEVVAAGFDDLEGRRPLDPARLLHIGSITKSMTCLAAYQLRERGLLDLNDRVGRHLPEAPLPDSADLTLRRLMDHTSGLPNSAPFFPRAHNGLWLGSRPGTHFAYSNMGYALLGAILERRFGTDFPTLMQRLVFGPLGMASATASIRSVDRPLHASGFAPMVPDRPFPTGGQLVEAPWVEFTGGAGSVAATAADMARYLSYLLRGARGEAAPLLSRGSFEEFATPRVAAPSFGDGAQYASGIAVTRAAGRYELHHTGGMLGFASAMVVDVLSGTAAFVSANAAIGGYRPRALAAFAASALAAARAGQPLPPPRQAVSPVSIDNAEEFVGEYRSLGGGRLVVRASIPGLAVELGGRSAQLERTQRADLFVPRDPVLGVAVLGFRRSGGGVTYAFHRSEVYVRDGAAPPRPPPAQWKTYEGRYANNDPWRGALRVYARPDGIWIDGVTPLVPLGRHRFREGEHASSPERVIFEAPFNGRFLRLNRSGVDFLRVTDDAGTAPATVLGSKDLRP